MEGELEGVRVNQTKGAKTLSAYACGKGNHSGRAKDRPIQGRKRAEVSIYC
ncbi:hypothetical protein M5D96_001272, partial [Drosophila gunungcola]